MGVSVVVLFFWEATRKTVGFVAMCLGRFFWDSRITWWQKKQKQEQKQGVEPSLSHLGQELFTQYGEAGWGEAVAVAWSLRRKQPEIWLSMEKHMDFIVSSQENHRFYGF